MRFAKKSLGQNFLLDNNKFSNEWNPINILSTDASRVGNYDLDIIDETNQVLKNLSENKYEILETPQPSEDPLNWKDTKSYKPTGNLVYNEDLFEALKNPFK